MIDGSHFSTRQADEIRANLSRTLDVAEGAKKLYGLTDGDCDACVIVDPRENAVIAVAHDLCQFEDVNFDDDDDDEDDDDDDAFVGGQMEKSSSSKPSRSSNPTFKIRPYYHAPMVAIDLVAASQGGGAYAIPIERFPLMSFVVSDTICPSSSSTAAPADDEVENDDDNDDDDDDDENDNSSGVTYLCTGYDVYLSKEPCLMCAMSLIHSRIRRLFYRYKSSDGALGSKFSIHTLESLNHHFEAFCLE